MKISQGLKHFSLGAAVCTSALLGLMAASQAGGMPHRGHAAYVALPVHAAYRSSGQYGQVAPLHRSLSNYGHPHGAVRGCCGYPSYGYHGGYGRSFYGQPRYYPAASAYGGYGRAHHYNYRYARQPSLYLPQYYQ